MAESPAAHKTLMLRDLLKAQEQLPNTQHRPENNLTFGASWAVLSKTGFLIKVSISVYRSERSQCTGA